MNYALRITCHHINWQHDFTVHSDSMAIEYATRLLSTNPAVAECDAAMLFNIQEDTAIQHWEMEKTVKLRSV